MPIGKDDSENVELRKVGTVPTFAFKTQDHITLGTEARHRRLRTRREAGR